MSEYTITDAAVGLRKSFDVSEEVLFFISRAMDAVETLGVLSGNKKKEAVFDMARGVIANFNEIESIISRLIDAVKQAYNLLKTSMKAVKEALKK